ncbi:MAG: hypothetical protein HC939_23755 [Pleurocapsa sp. SU_5_0]|nr:hypothetical protein [Pleurocapsa sp. SU_5_0]
MSFSRNSDWDKKSAEIVESIRRGTEERSGYANVMFEGLLEEIKIFQSELESDKEIGAYLTSFSNNMLITIESISYRDPYYFVLSGTNNEGHKVKLVQHVKQTNILFVPIKVLPEEGRKPKRFGF